MFRKRESQYHPRYLDRVEITGGFYRGYKGIITDEATEGRWEPNTVYEVDLSEMTLPKKITIGSFWLRLIKEWKREEV